MPINLNNFAVRVTLKEGKKMNLSIGQVKEVMKIVFTLMSKMTIEDIAKLLKKYKGVK